MFVEYEFESVWRKAVAKCYPKATIVVTGRRQNRDNLSARVGEIEVGQYRREDNDPPGGWLRQKPPFTLHQRNVGRNGNIITHWSSGPGNYTFDADCWWCRFKQLIGSEEAK